MVFKTRAQGGRKNFGGIVFEISTIHCQERTFSSSHGHDSVTKQNTRLEIRYNSMMTLNRLFFSP